MTDHQGTAMAANATASMCVSASRRDRSRGFAGPPDRIAGGVLAASMTVCSTPGGVGQTQQHDDGSGRCGASSQEQAGRGCGSVLRQDAGGQEPERRGR
jgi:hypothetical protein